MKVHVSRFLRKDANIGLCVLLNVFDSPLSQILDTCLKGITKKQVIRLRIFLQGTARLPYALGFVYRQVIFICFINCLSPISSTLARDPCTQSDYFGLEFPSRNATPIGD